MYTEVSDKQKVVRYILNFARSGFRNASVLTYVLGAQKNHLIETVLLSTHIFFV